MAITKASKIYGFDIKEYTRIEQVNAVVDESTGTKLYNVTIALVKYVDSTKKDPLGVTELRTQMTKDSDITLTKCYQYIKQNPDYSEYTDC